MGLTAGAATLAVAKAAKAACALTAAQVDGPFYPTVIGEHDWDLTRVSGAAGRAEGEVIEVTGQVRDARCRPVPNSVIEVWQANIHGRYSHPRDTAEDRPLDPNFQGYARLVTDGEGAYRFVTIVPGSYAAMGDWVRPPHIHFKAHASLNPTVTTQMYFAGDPLNDKDLLLAPLSPAQRAALEVPFDRVTADGVRAGTFDLVLADGWAPPEGIVVPGSG
jgi:protocatechuate 3,4-dioxygenase beta subunit